MSPGVHVSRFFAALIVALMLAAGGWKLYVQGRTAGRAQVQQQLDQARLQASETARAQEAQWQTQVQGIDRELQAQKARNAALARAHAQRLRDFQSALDRAAATQDTAAPSGTAGPFATIARECAAALGALDTHAGELAAIASALQSYATGVCVSKD